MGKEKLSINFGSSLTDLTIGIIKLTKPDFQVIWFQVFIFKEDYEICLKNMVIRMVTELTIGLISEAGCTEELNKLFEGYLKKNRMVDQWNAARGKEII